MNKSPTIKIDGKRYIARYLKAGAYKQIMMLIDVMDDLSQEDLHDDLLKAIQLTFDLTDAEADRVNVSDIIPTFSVLAVWAKMAFISKAAQIPNSEGPEATAGQS